MPGLPSGDSVCLMYRQSEITPHLINLSYADITVTNNIEWIIKIIKMMMVVVMMIHVYPSYTERDVAPW